jgi:uncharacterized peroxidase-related enzyme
VPVRPIIDPPFAFRGPAFAVRENDCKRRSNQFLTEPASIVHYLSLAPAVLDIGTGGVITWGMPHIDLPPLPGLPALLVGHPETAGPLTHLAQSLLRGPSPLTPLERETIGAYVSRRNECTFCAETHAAVAQHLDGSGESGADPVDGGPAGTGPKLRALLAIADKVRVDGRSVTAEDVARARAAGADDRTIHDTVLIAAAFCMFNRYVDGLGTALPDDPAHYQRHARAIAENGYLRLPS